MALDAAAAAPSRHASGASASALRPSLIDGLQHLGVAASSAQVDALLHFLDLLAKWGKVYNLTAVRNLQDMLVIHLLDSLAILDLVDRVAPTSIVDVGSGAGLPAIPLAILRPEVEIVSVDAVAKKIGFQLQAKAALGLARLRPVHGRVESLRLDRTPSLIVSRAYAPLAAMLASIDRLADRSTMIVAMKGARPDDEIAALSADWVVDDVIPLDVPFLGAARCAVLLRRATA